MKMAIERDMETLDITFKITVTPGDLALDFDKEEAEFLRGCDKDGDMVAMLSALELVGRKASRAYLNGDTPAL